MNLLEVKDTMSVDKKLTMEITGILNSFGAMPNLRGFNYLRRAIILAYSNHNYLNCITKMLYYDIAKEFNTTDKNIERNIRHLLSTTWKRNVDQGTYPKIGIHRFVEKPTNSEFIAAVVDYLKVYVLD